MRGHAPDLTASRGLLRTAGCIALALGPAAVHAAILPYDSHTRANGTTFGAGLYDGGTQEDFNKRDLFVKTKFVDAVGNESFGSASVHLDEARLTAVDHACSGGAPTYEGNATGGGYTNIDQVYQLISSSLPAGTMVPVRFEFGSAARLIAEGAELDYYNDSGSTGANVQMQLQTVEFTPQNLVAVQGGVTRTITPSGNQKITSGNFQPEFGHETVNFMLAVGSSVRLAVSASATAGSTALGSGEIDADGQLSVGWGFDVTGDATMGTDDVLPMPAPPASNGTPEQAMLTLPDPAETLPEPAIGGLLACGGLAGLRRRR